MSFFRIQDNSCSPSWSGNLKSESTRSMLPLDESIFTAAPTDVALSTSNPFFLNHV